MDVMGCMIECQVASSQLQVVEVDRLLARAKVIVVDLTSSFASGETRDRR